MAKGFRASSVPTVVEKAPARSERVEERHIGMVATGINTQPVGKRDVRMYRTWADRNEWIRAAINHRKTQISTAPWDVPPIDGDLDYDQEAQIRLIELFENPSPKTDNFRAMIEALIEDILVLDAGTLENLHNMNGVPVQLWTVDGATIRISPVWNGEPNQPRYFWYPNGRFGAALMDNELIYMMQNPASHRVLGLSPLETLYETIEAEFAAARYNKGQVLQAPPSGIIDLGEDATPQNIDEFETYWKAEIAGVKATAIIGGTKNPKFISFGKSNKDMQFLQWQSYLIRKIAAVFQISPQDLGILFDVNRANAEVQAEISEDRGLRPLIALIESHFNKEVVGEWARARAKAAYYHGDISHSDMRAAVALSFVDPIRKAHVYKQMPQGNILNLAFKFKIPSGRNGRSRAEIHKIELGGIPYKTINEAREEELSDPVDGGDEIIVATPLGPVRLGAIQGSLIPSAQEQKMLDAIFENAPLILREASRNSAQGLAPAKSEQ